MNSQLSLSFPSSLAAVCVLGSTQVDIGADSILLQHQYSTSAFTFSCDDALQDAYDVELVKARRDAPVEPLSDVLRDLGLES